MDGESHGGEAAEVELAEGQEDAQAQRQAELGGAVANSDFGYEAQLTKRDERIAELEAQVAEAAVSKEAAEALRSEIEAVKAAAADERVELVHGGRGRGRHGVSRVPEHELLVLRVPERNGLLRAREPRQRALHGLRVREQHVARRARPAGVRPQQPDEPAVHVLGLHGADDDPR